VTTIEYLPLTPIPPACLRLRWCWCWRYRDRLW